MASALAQKIVWDLTPADVDARVPKAFGAVLRSGYEERPDDIVNVFPMPNVQAEEPRDGHVSGYVTVLEDTGRIKPLLPAALGMGVSWQRVERRDGQPITRNNTRDVATPSVKLAASANHAVSLVHAVLNTNDAFPEDATFVVARAHDPAVTQAFLDKLPEDATAADVVNGTHTNAYEGVLSAAADVRKGLIEQFMNDHDFQATGEDLKKAHTTFVKAALGYSKSSKTGKTAVYNNAFDPSAAQDGIAIFRGPAAGFSFAQSETPGTKFGFTSYSWNNATESRGVSVAPATTGLHQSDKRKKDRHFHASAKMAAEAAARITWTGDIQSYSPHAESVFNSVHDREFLAAMSKLGVGPGGTAQFTHGETLAGKVPGIETRFMTAKELQAVLGRAREVDVPVSNRNPVVIQSLQQWDAVAAAAGYEKMADMFSTESNNELWLSAEHCNALT